QFYPEHDGFGLSAAACLLLRVLEANYSGGMGAGANPYQYVLSVLEQYGQGNDFLKTLAHDWHTKADPHG
ncbi:MAG: hypothetical protein NTW96_26640, partial [Planctomycetia bacterium]|nr:hypothetical protein [Planctomycetia bacterium]